MRLITTGGDAFEAERERWNDANNVSPCVPAWCWWAMKRNIWTNEKIRQSRHYRPSHSRR
ncbi:hypothetical protein KCP78_22845 [Salmonella enterica subsp. enterica]|nr:hypothetical protein KCP78_22845 [Salmonella enterica subsp. enterica]